jgi:hypothetical protein
VPLTIVQVLFNAGTIFLLRALQATTSPRIAHGALNTALAQVETCLKYLQEVAGTWPSGVRTRDTLQAIVNDRLRPVLARRLAQKGEPASSSAAATHSSSSSSPSSPSPSLSEKPAPPVTYAGEPSLESILSTMPAPTYASSSWNPQQLVPSWTQSPIDFFAQTQNAPAATAFDAQSLYDSTFADVDMTALLPSIDYFPAQELWEQGIMGDDRAARMLFSQGSS